MKSKKNRENYDQDDLQEHDVKDIIPKNENWYSLDLKRGDDEDVDNIPELDISDKDPSSDDFDEPTKSSSFYEGQVVKTRTTMPFSSNDGGVVDKQNMFDQNKVSGVAGEPGGNIDEDTG